MNIMVINRTIQEFYKSDNLNALIEAINDLFKRLSNSDRDTESQILAAVYSALLMNGIKMDIIKENMLLVLRTQKSLFITGIGLDVNAEDIIHIKEMHEYENQFSEEKRNVYLLALSYSRTNMKFSQWKTEIVEQSAGAPEMLRGMHQYSATL